MGLSGLNFERAQYGGELVSLDHCKWCGRGIAGEYFRVDGEILCGVCIERLRNVLPKDTRAVFWRATGAGFVTAVGASLAYVALIRLMRTFGSGYGLAFGAIGVGFAVGRAMHVAAKGAGGRRYQVVASLLTYAAISVGLAVDLLRLDSIPVWAFPLLVFTPLINLFLGNMQLGGLELFVAAIGVRWAWAQVRAHGIKIVGPERVSEAKDC